MCGSFGSNCISLKKMTDMRSAADRHDDGCPEPASVVDALRAKGCIVDFRPGLVRLSPHYFNTEDEMDATLEHLAPLREKVPA